MKKSLLKLIEKYLQALARSKVAISKPKIVAITGSYGKTSTKEAIFHLLSKKFGSDVSKNWGNMNSVLGLPMAVLGMRRYSFGPRIFVDIINATWRYFFYHMPKILVLEYGIDRPGEMVTLLDVATPDIAVVNGISEAHIEGLGDLATIKKQKGLLLQSLGRSGVAILNKDDANSEGLKVPGSASKIYVGSGDADVAFSATVSSASGITFDLAISKEKKRINSKVIGKHSIYSLLFAAAVASQFSVDPEEIKKGIEEIRPQKGRMNLLKIKNGIIVIDDSYNSNPKSASEALSALKEIMYDGRKVAILGNMNELGSFTKEGHLLVGKAAAGCADLLIVSGDNAKYFEQGAKDAGMAVEKIKLFVDTDSLIKEINGLLKPGDLVLVKGSQNRVRLERLVKYLIDDKEFAEKILVRQEKKWLQPHG